MAYPRSKARACSFIPLERLPGTDVGLVGSAGGDEVDHLERQLHVGHSHVSLSVGVRMAWVVDSWKLRGILDDLLSHDAARSLQIVENGGENDVLARNGPPCGVRVEEALAMLLATTSRRWRSAVKAEPLMLDARKRLLKDMGRLRISGRRSRSAACPAAKPAPGRPY